MAKFFLLLTFVLTLALVSCNKATPAGFWKNYQKQFLIKNISNQGTHGGHRAIYWKADKSNTFNSPRILEFASNNGWVFVDSSEFTGQQVSKWITYNKDAIFPLTSVGFSDTVIQSTQLDYFPRWFSGPVKVYTFKTGWVTIEPGTDDSIEENGFVVINSDKREMAVYHLWGE